MKRVLMLLIPFILVFLFSGASLMAQEDVKARIEAMEKELQLLKSSLTKQEEKVVRDQAIITELKEKDELQAKKIEHLEERIHVEEFYYGPKKADEFYKKGLSPQFGGIYTKPFLARFGRNTYLGGYMDASFRSTESSNDKFEVLRFVPFIYSDVSDRVKVAAEIEFEHGGITPSGSGVISETGVSTPSPGEVKLEFATIDFLIRDWLNMRAGLILVPLGKFNLVHDAPLQDLVDRPLVDQFIIPTTLTQAGMGFFGSLYPTEMSKLDYEIYATNGFGNNINPTTNGLRGARLFRYDFDNNQSPAVVSRVAFSPFLGLEFGGSVMYNKYESIGSEYFTIPALDFVYQKGPFELVGEGAYVDFERGKDIKTDTTKRRIPSSMFGYYIEPRYHFMPKFLQDFAPKIFTDRSTFTLTGRWEQVDLGQISGSSGAEGGRANRMDRATIGLNYRYTEDSVFKIDYQWNIEHSKNHTDNNAFIFGWATYF